MDYKKLSDTNLKKEYLTTWQVVFKEECFGTRDLIALAVMECELNNRGIEVVENTTCQFVKS